MSMCQQGGEFLGEVIKQGGDLFDLKNLLCTGSLRVHHFGRVALVRGKSFAWGASVLFLALEFFLGFPQISA